MKSEGVAPGETVFIATDEQDRAWFAPIAAVYNVSFAADLEQERRYLAQRSLAQHSPLAAHRSLLTTHCSPPTAHRQTLTAHCTPPTAYRCWLTAF